VAKIEWTDITRNPVKGKCPNACPYCYAIEIYNNNKWDPSIRFRPEVLDDLPRKPCRVFVGSTMELLLFPEWLPAIFDRCRQHPEHTFIFLTKLPRELPKWSPFPENCEVGVTVTDREAAHQAFFYIPLFRAKVKFLSLEPLLDDVTQYLYFWNLVRAVDGIIIGGMTGRKGKLMQLQKEHFPQMRLEKLDAVGRKWTLLPRLEWVKRIIEEADAAGIPVFLKDNLYKLAMERPVEDHDLYWEDMSTLRQELPRRSCGDQGVTTLKAVVTSSSDHPKARVTSGGGD